MPLTVGHRIDRAHPHPGDDAVVTAAVDGLDVPVEHYGNAVRVRLVFDQPGTYVVEWAANGVAWITDTLRVLPADANRRNMRLG